MRRNVGTPPSPCHPLNSTCQETIEARCRNQNRSEALRHIYHVLDKHKICPGMVAARYAFRQQFEPLQLLQLCAVSQGALALALRAGLAAAGPPAGLPAQLGPCTCDSHVTLVAMGSQRDPVRGCALDSALDFPRPDSPRLLDPTLAESRAILRRVQALPRCSSLSGGVPAASCTMAKNFKHVQKGFGSEGLSQGRCLVALHEAECIAASDARRLDCSVSPGCTGAATSIFRGPGGSLFPKCLAGSVSVSGGCQRDHDGFHRALAGLGGRQRGRYSPS